MLSRSAGPVAAVRPVAAGAKSVFGEWAGAEEGSDGKAKGRGATTDPNASQLQRL